MPKRIILLSASIFHHCLVPSPYYVCAFKRTFQIISSMDIVVNITIYSLFIFLFSNLMEKNELKIEYTIFSTYTHKKVICNWNGPKIPIFEIVTILYWSGLVKMLPVHTFMCKYFVCKFKKKRITINAVSQSW